MADTQLTDRSINTIRFLAAAREGGVLRSYLDPRRFFSKKK